MAESSLQMEIGLIFPALTTGFPSISTPRRMRYGIDKFEGLSHSAGKEACRNSLESSVQEGEISKELQESSWRHFFADPTQWWDSDIGYKFAQIPLCRNNWCKPSWLDLQVSTFEASINTPPESLSTSVEGQGDVERLGAHEGPLEIGICRKLCESGRISDAVDALNRRVKQGCHVDSNLFFLVLKRCIAHNDLVMGRRIHDLIAKSGYEGDSFLATHVISMYASHGRLDEAMRVFTKVSVLTIYIWTNIIFAYARHGEAAEAIRLYRQMLASTTIQPDNRLYVAVLKACATAADLVAGKEVHAHVLAARQKPDVFVQAALVSMYAKCGSLGDAHRVFDRLPEKDVVTWTSLISGYTQQGMGQEALNLYSRMQHEGPTAPNSVTYVCLLQACASVGVEAVDHGRQIHAQIEELRLQGDLVLVSSLVNMYAKCGSLGDARRIFDKLPERDVVTWNALLAGYTQQGMGLEALNLYSIMQRECPTLPNSVTYVCLLQACASVGIRALDQGQQLHADLEQQGLEGHLVLGGSLVNMYVKCGSLGDARRLFDRLPQRNVVTWTSLIAGYAQQGMGQEALSLYRQMQQEGLTPPNSVTYVCLLQACASVGIEALDQGKQLHAEIEEQGLVGDLVLGGSLVNMYAKCGSLQDARKVFDRLPVKDVVAWNALLVCYAQQGMGQEALNLYSSMQFEGLTVPNSVTYACLLQACASVGVGALDQGKQLNAEFQEQGLEEDLVLGGSLVNMYSKCGSLGDARRVFDRLLERDVVTWTVLIAQYAYKGMVQEALSLYSRMQQEGSIAPDSVTYVCLLQACASVAALPLGKSIHAQIEEQGLQADVAVGSGLVNMYARCGSMFDSQQVFDSLPERSFEAWNALTSGYARQGDSEVVFDLVNRMRLEGMQPDGITFLCLLTVCSHVGEVDKGRQYFETMTSDYGISPTIEHYTCMVDLLGRAGHLNEALQMAKTMPFLPDVTLWHTLLGCCRKWKNVKIGQQAFEFAVATDGQDAASYSLMSNIYACAKMWEEANHMQARRVKSGAWKKPGQSWWTDHGGVVHTFVVGGKKQPESEGRLKISSPQNQEGRICVATSVVFGEHSR